MIWHISLNDFIIQYFIKSGGHPHIFIPEIGQAPRGETELAPGRKPAIFGVNSAAIPGYVSRHAHTPFVTDL